MSCSTRGIGIVSAPRSSLCDLLCSITRIEQKFLRGEAPLEDASIAKRMSWAADRDTSRTEDIAYSLLGLFDINMPLLYGEGSKAFLRLQGELVKSYPYDHSIFAWGKVVYDEPSCIVKDRKKLDQPDAIDWDTREASKTLSGLLARSPKDFASSGHFIPCDNYRHLWTPDTTVAVPTMMPGGGVSLELGTTRDGSLLSAYHLHDAKVATLRLVSLGYLICGYKSSEMLAVAIPLMRWGGKSLGRTNEIIVLRRPMSIPSALKYTSVFHVNSDIPPNLESGDLFMRLCSTSRASYSTSYMPPSVFSMANGLFKVHKRQTGLVFAYKFHLLADRSLGFCLAFEREDPFEGVDEGVTTTTRTTITLLPTLLSELNTKHPIVAKKTGLNWFTSQQRWSQLATRDFERSNSRTLKGRKDSCEINVYPFPLMKITVKKTKIENSKGSEKSGYFDLIDISMRDTAASSTAPQKASTKV